ncbi:hypothetical protein RB195_010833 [Necator americanus]|uniref:Receptor L-domain domain-containing protein n=1 Tax=Necator americanus TaxID=51031 RepID=A0ABR1D1Y9_NECAM
MGNWVGRLLNIRLHSTGCCLMAVQMVHNFTAAFDLHEEYRCIAAPRKHGRFVYEIIIVFVVSAAMSVNSVEATPPVDKNRPFDDASASCYFQGKYSLYSKIYNIEEFICLNFYGKLELDADMTEVELQNIVTIRGCLIIRGTQIKSANLAQISDLVSDPAYCEYNGLLIYDNPELDVIEFSEEFQPNPSDVSIRMNPLLSKEKIVNAKFELDIGSSETDCSVAEAKSKEQCNTLVGDVTIDDLKDIGPGRIAKVVGRVSVEETAEEDLEVLRSLEITGWGSPALTISRNEKLVDVSALPTVKVIANKPAVNIETNPKICDNVANRKKIEKWLLENDVSMKIDTYCLRSCEARRVSEKFLLELHKHCNVLEGDLVIDNLKELPNDIEKLEQVEEINGRLLVINSPAVHKLTFFKNLKKINNPVSNQYPHSLMIYGNKELDQILFNREFSPKPDEVFIRLNPKLTTDGVEGASFEVNIGASTDCFATLAFKLTQCKRLIGDVNFKELPLDVWERIEEIEGTLSVADSNVEDLDALRGLKIVAWKVPPFVISHNYKLIDIAALLTMQVESKSSPLVMNDNPKICHNIAERKQLEKFLENVRVSVPFSQHCLRSCDGGNISERYLSALNKHCNVIQGNVILHGIEKLPENIRKLEQVEIINGRLLVTDNPAIDNLLFLQNLREINNPELYKPGIVVKNNKKHPLTGLLSLQKVTGSETSTAVTKKVKHSSTKSYSEKTTRKNDRSTSKTKDWTKKTTQTMKRPKTTTKKIPNPVEDKNGNKVRNQTADKGISGNAHRKGKTSSSKKYGKLIWLVIIILLIMAIGAVVAAVVIVRMRRGKQQPKERPGTVVQDAQKKDGGTKNTDAPAMKNSKSSEAVNKTKTQSL